MKSVTVTEQQINDMWWSLQAALHELEKSYHITEEIEDAIASLQGVLNTLRELKGGLK